MKTYIVAFFCALFTAALLTPLVARLGHRIKALDLPGEARKIHTRAIPRIGGIAVVAAFFAPIAALAIYTNPISDLIYADRRLVLGLGLGAAAIVALGVYDDVRGAGAKLKLTVQSIVALIVWYAGFRIQVIGNPLGAPIDVGLWSLPLTWLWIVGVVNALNLIDGLDGLAAGVSLFAVMVLFGVSFVDSAVLLCVVTAALAGALIGFLFFNFNPAKIFLGDSGSMFLGFILATASLWTQRKGATAAALLIPVMALGLPILDTMLSVIRRVGRGRSPLQADREHLHHRLLALGLSHQGAVFTLYTASAVFALGALAMLDNDVTRRAIALSTVAAVVVILVRRVGVFGAPISMRPVDSHSLPLRDEVRALSRRIRGADTIEGAWAGLSSIGTRLGLDEIRLAWSEDGGRETVYHWRRPKSPRDAESSSRAPSGGWRLDRDLSPYDQAKRLVLEENGVRVGDLTVLFARGFPEEERAERDLALELLRDAMIDMRVLADQIARAADDDEIAGRVVQMPRGKISNRPLA